MWNTPFLQSVVAPIGRYTETDAAFIVHKIHGTGFFVGTGGHFFTARHVLEDAFAEATSLGQKVGIFPLQETPLGKKNISIQIKTYERAPDQIDIAIGCTPYCCKSFLRLASPDVEVWQDVATLGYAEDVMNKTDEKYEIQQRVHKGYIQRKIPADRIRLGPKADSFELSFKITAGMSGSPLFIHKGEFDVVIGVCVGTSRSQIVDYEHIEIIDGGITYKERILRVEEFGLAHDIRPLMQWAPKTIGEPLAETKTLV